MRNIILGIFAIGVLASAVFYGLQNREEPSSISEIAHVEESADQIADPTVVLEPENEPEENTSPQETTESNDDKKGILNIFTPDETKRFSLDAAFTPQAPTGNWDDPYSEACEEVSLLIAKSVVQKDLDAFADPVATESLILDLVNREKALFNGTWVDTDAVLTKRMGEELLGLEIEIVDNPSVEDIEDFILSGYPVIAPLAGREIGNPHFSGEGPIYHMVVITGYTPQDFITQEPGTRFGQDYKYDKSVIMSALSDWDQAADGLSGEMRILVVKSAN